MKEKRLFRPEVLANNKNRNYGSALINTPAQYKVITMVMMVIVLLIVIFLLMGEFSEKFVVKGYLESIKGIARVYPTKAGIIAKSFFKQGDLVKKGDLLFLIDTTIGGYTKKINDSVLSELEKKKQSIEDSIFNKQQYLQTLKQLLIKKYIPLSLYNEKQDQVIELQHQANNVELDIIHHKSSSAYAIHSPATGVIASISYQTGQYVNSNRALLKILPRHTDLIAKLYIPVKKSGFIQPNDRAIIRFDAYPYARFGVYTATIHDISSSIMTDEEEEKPMRIGQPYYKATAWLDQQFVMLHGAKKELQQGMTISVVILGAKRKIWQWIFDPIYNFYGNLRI